MHHDRQEFCRSPLDDKHPQVYPEFFLNADVIDRTGPYSMRGVTLPRFATILIAMVVQVAATLRKRLCWILEWQRGQGNAAAGIAPIRQP